MKADQLLNFVIKPTLAYLELDSPSAQNLLLGTCAQESRMGEYIKQYPSGPGMGIYQEESRDHQNIITAVGSRHPSLYSKLIQLRSVKNQYSNLDSELITNLSYATAIARLHYYLWSPDPLPDASDIPGLAAYYKRWYNSPEGAATEQEFIDNYKRYVL